MQREIGIIIRVKDAAKAKQEIKSIVDNQVLGQVDKLNGKFKETGEAVEKAGVKAKASKDAFESLFNKFTKGAAILYTLKRGISAAFTSFEQGAGLERAGVQFENSVGRVSQVLPSLRSATRNTVTDLKLLETANRAVMEGLNPKNLTKMYQMATVASRKLGLQGEQAIQTMSNAIIRQDESALTTLGTILKTNIGLRVQNALIAKNGGVMAGAAAIAIRQSVIMEELNKRFGGFNALQEDSVEIIERFRATMSNLRMTLGTTIGYALAPLLKVITGLAEGFNRLLARLNDSAAFRTVIKNLGALVAILGTAKLVKSLMFAAKAVGMFTVGLKGLAIATAGLAGLKILGIEFGDVGTIASKSSTAIDAFFQLINSFDGETGISKVLTADKEALGSHFTWVTNAAKAYQVLKYAAIGAYEGIADSFNRLPIIGGVIRETIKGIKETVNLLTLAIRAVADSVQKFFDTLSLSHLNRIKEMFKSAFFFPSYLESREMQKSTKQQVQETVPAAAAPALDYQNQKQVTSYIPPAPEVREQNVSSVSSNMETTMVLADMLKELKSTKESNVEMNRRDEQRDLQERTKPSLMETTFKNR